jgi:hypothetical protein
MNKKQAAFDYSILKMKVGYSSETPVNIYYVL